MPFRNMPLVGELASVEVKVIGETYLGELHPKFVWGGNRPSFHGKF